MTGPIRVLVADPSSVLRRALVSLLGEDPRIWIVGEASEGFDAVEQARRLRPDVIVLDADLPGLDGLSATQAIMIEAPARVLILSSEQRPGQEDLPSRAREAGALEIIVASEGGAAELIAFVRKVVESVRLMAEVPVVGRRRGTPAALREVPAHEAVVDVFGFVASTGGPPALARVLGELPADLPIPLLVAQHIAPGFVGGLARWLASVSKLQILTAIDGDKPRPGHVYLAPDRCDLLLERSGHLRTPLSTGLHCPSGDLLLRSLASSYGRRAGGMVMTGMGDDGADGLLALRTAGGATFAQDEGSSLVFAMPQAAWARGATRSLLAPEAVAPILLALCGSLARRGGEASR